MRLPLLFVPTFLLLVSCVEEVELDLGESVREQLVVLSNFNTNGQIQVVVSSSRGVLANPIGQFVYYQNADVRLYDEADNLLEVLCLTGSDVRDEVPFYSTKDFVPQPRVAYTIRVRVPGFEEAVEATGVIPEAVRIDHIQFDNTYDSSDPLRTVIDFDVQVSFTDPTDERNFYHLTFFQELFPKTDLSDTSDVLGPVLVPLRVDGRPDNPPLLPYAERRGALIEDGTFNGEQVTYHFTGRLVFDSDDFVPGDFVTELRTVSQPYYDYHASLSRQHNGHPGGSGVDLDDNTFGGVGVFAGYGSNYSSNTINN